MSGNLTQVRMSFNSPEALEVTSVEDAFYNIIKQQKSDAVTKIASVPKDSKESKVEELVGEANSFTISHLASWLRQASDSEIESFGKAIKTANNLHQADFDKLMKSANYTSPFQALIQNSNNSTEEEIIDISEISKE